MTRAQVKILAILREKGEVYREYANSPSISNGEVEKIFKKYANECTTAARILTDAYKK